jgi:hypothetical protein
MLRDLHRSRSLPRGADGLSDQTWSNVPMHVAFAQHEYLPSITKSWTTARVHQSLAASLFSLEDKRWRLNVLVEGVRRVRKAALSVGAIVEFHRDVEHHEISGGHTSA